MRVVLMLVALGLALVAGAPKNIQRIVGGEVTSIENYPFMASMMYSWNLLTFHQSCGGAILNSRAILSAAHCFSGDATPRWRVRVGSTMANSGGVVHHLRAVFNHPDYRTATAGADISILHTNSIIVFNQLVQPMVVPGPGYNLPHDAPVVAIGWGTTSPVWEHHHIIKSGAAGYPEHFAHWTAAYNLHVMLCSLGKKTNTETLYKPGGVQSEQLREVQVWHVSNAICRARYAMIGIYITNDMLCSGWLDVGGRDQCQGDSGGPLIHGDNVVVGVCSWGNSCALQYYPGVNARVSAFTDWIQRTA